MAATELGAFLAARRGERRLLRAPGTGTGTPSFASVLDAVARALDLGTDAREHLFRLAAAAPTPAPAAQPPTTVDQRLVAHFDASPDTPAMVINRCLDIPASNALAAMQHSEFMPATIWPG